MKTLHDNLRGTRTASRVSLLAAVLLAAAGCMTVGPDYRTPGTILPAGWNGAGAPGAASVPTAQAAEIAAWWKTFKDPELDSLVARAFAANLDLKQAESRIRQARAQYGVVDAGLWPSVNAGGGYSHSRSGGQGKAANVYRAGLDASWELDFFGGARRASEAAEADITASVEGRRDLLVTLSAEVAVDYLSLRGLRQQITVARENLGMQEKSAEIARKRFTGGFNSRLDVVNAEAQVASTRSQIPVLEAQARQSAYALALLLALEPSALDAELAKETPIPAAPPEVPAGLPSDLLTRRPDIRQAEAQLHAATARIGEAKSALFPKITLTGSAGVSNNKLPSLVSWDRRNYSIGPSVTWPLLDFGRVRSGIKVQDELAQQAVLAYRKAVLTALNDVESALVAYVNEQLHRQALAEAVAANRQAVDLSSRLYAAGQVEFINVIAAQQSLLSAQNALIQSDRSIATDLVAIYKALGGGWDPKGAAAGNE